LSESKLEKLSVKNDFVFKKLFSKKGNEAYLIQFLSDLLLLDIKSIEIKHDVVLERNIEDEKIGILDIKATLNNNTYLDIEMQMGDEKNVVKRSTYYAAKMMSEQLQNGEKYKEIKPVIVIFIMNFNYFPFEEHINKTRTVLNNHIEYDISNDMVYYYIELPKFRKKECELKDITSQWLTFIDGENKKELEKVMKDNNLIKEANKELDILSGDEDVRRMAELRQKYVMEMASAKSDGYDEGLAKGEENKAIDIAKKMLQKKMDVDVICEVTGLDKDIVENLKCDE